MTSLFGVPILLAIALGLAFPFAALTFASYAFVFLFLLMVGAGFTGERSPFSFRMQSVGALAFGLLLSVVLVPALQLLLAGAWLEDRLFAWGTYFSALMPAALVAPFFTQLLEGDEPLAFQIMWLATLGLPLTLGALLPLAPLGDLKIDSFSLLASTMLLVLGGPAVALALSRFLPALARAWRARLALINSLCLGALIFVLFGAVSSRLNMSYLPRADMARALGLAFFQDFGMLFLVLGLSRLLFDERQALAIAVCAGMKNTAIAASLALFFVPKAGLPAAATFVAHACLFSFVPVWARWRRRGRAATAATAS